MAVKVFDPMEKVNPAFYPVWISECANVLTKGGRSSTKSSVISLKLIEKKMKHKMSNAVILRKVGQTLRKSVYSQVQWALHEVGVADQFKFQVNPLQIIHKEWNTGFHFSGSDDPEKLKSLKIPVGYVSDLWLEEADSFDSEEEIDKIQDTFIRNDLPDGQEVVTWMSWNPPKSQYHWIYDYVDKHQTDSDFLIHHSTYLDDTLGFNSQQILRKIAKYQENDPEYHDWMYLGKPYSFGDEVYNMALFQPLDELPDDDKTIALFYSMDTGHSVSANACGLFGLTAKRNVILLNTYYYSPAGKVFKKAPSEIAKELNQFVVATSNCEHWLQAPILNRTIDSAEAALKNQYRKDYGQIWNPVNKGKKADMIDTVHDLLAQGRFYYLKEPYKTGLRYCDSNAIFIEEHKHYQWKPKTIHTDDPKVIKEDDHTCDMFQYFCVDNARELGLRS